MADTFTFSGTTDTVFLGSDCINLVSDNTNGNSAFGPDVFNPTATEETQIAEISNSGGYLHIELDDGSYTPAAGNYILLYNDTDAQGPIAGIHLITSTFNSGVDVITNTEYLECFGDITEANMNVGFFNAGLSSGASDERFVGAGSVCVSNNYDGNHRFRQYHAILYTNCWLDFVTGVDRCGVTTSGEVLETDTEFTAPKAHFISGVCAPTAHSI